MQNNLDKQGLLYNLLDIPLIYNLFQNLLKRRGQTEKFFTQNIIVDSGLILECGCGPAINRHFFQNEYIGIDINSKYIDSAKIKYPNDKFYVCKIENIENLDLMNVSNVLVIGLLHHLNDEQCKNLFNSLEKILTSNGKIYTLDPVFIPKQRRIAKFLAKKDRGNFVRKKEQYLALVGSNFETESLILNNQLRVPFDHLFLTIHKN